MEKQSGYADVNDTRIFYEIAGEGPVLVLIHGFAMDVRTWNDQFETFAKQYRILRYDLRGFGKSMQPKGTPYEHADDLKALLDYLSIEEANILGHSFGGRVAIAFAILYPEMTLSLIGADPALEGYEPDDSSYQTVMNELGKVWTSGRESGVDTAKDLFLQFSPIKPAMLISNLAARIKQMVDDYSGWHWVNEDSYQPLNPPAAEQLDKIKSPTLIIIGELNPRCFHQTCDFLTEKIPNAKMIVIPNVAHMLNMEDPVQFNIEILKFLQSF